MRYAIVSDIHANWQAWCAVREDIKARGADAIVCLGDIVGYGPSPTRVVSDLRKHCDNFVLGNHDAAAAGQLDPSVFNEAARRSTEWTAKQFDKYTIRELGSAPLVLEDEQIIFVHAETVAPDDFGYVEEIDDVRACFAATDKRFIFLGHTHRPRIFVQSPDGNIVEQPDKQYTAGPDERCLVNVGSVGDPGDGTTLASYGLFDSDTGAIDLRHVPFDIDAYARELQQVPELATPWFLKHRTEEGFRPARDQAVAAGKVARATVRITASRAQIRVKAGALPTPADVLAKTRPPPPPRRRRGGLVAAGLAAALAAGGAGYWQFVLRETPAPDGAPATEAAKPARPRASARVATTAKPDFDVWLSASAEERTKDKTNTTAMAMDGSLETRWCSGNGQTGHWIQLDLGGRRRLSGLEIAWEIPDEPYAFAIQYGSDAKNWLEAWRGTGKSGDRTAFVAESRYLRIVVTKMPPRKWASICEITLFDDEGKKLRMTRDTVAALQTFQLTAPDAKLNGKRFVRDTFDGIPSIGGWTDKGQTMSWPFWPDEAGLFEVDFDYALTPGGNGNEFVIASGTNEIKATLRSTPSWTQFTNATLGRMRLSARPTTITLKCTRLAGGGAVNVRSLTFRQVPD